MSSLPHNLLKVYTAHGLNGVLGVAAVPVAVSLLGIEGYGLLSIYSLLVSYILMADFGVGKNLLRLLAESQSPERQLRQIRIALGLYILICGVWIVLAPLLIFAAPRYLFPVPPEVVPVVRWIAVLSIAELILGVPASLMQTACVASQRFDRYALYSVATGLTKNGAIILGALVFRSAEGIAAVLAARKLVEAWMAVELMGSLPAGSWAPLFDRRSLRTMLGQSATLSSAQVLYSTLMSAGSFLVNGAFGLHGLGLYRAASDLAGKIAFVANGATLVVFPRAARYFSSNGAAKDADARFASLLIASAGGYACFAALALSAARFVLPAIGLKDDTIVQLFIVLVVGMSINAHSLLSNELNQASGRYRYNLYFSFCALASLAPLFAIFRPFAGLLSIGWAWLGAALVSACVADALLLKIAGARPSCQFKVLAVKLIAAAACAGLAAQQLGLLGNPAAGLCALTIGVLLISAIRRAASLRHDWTESSQRANQVLEPACT